jgi:hypothetical protein
MIGDFVRRLSALLFICFVLIGTCVLSLAGTAAAESTTYTPETPVVDTIEGGPWNTSQGDSSAGSAYPFSDLLPAFTPGGPETTLGGVSEPNVAVYPGEQKVIEGGKEVTKLIPYPSGVAGTPGPLDGYCSSLGANPETGSPVSQPAGTSLPFSPYYFPDVVRNADGSLIGYFDYRPKDAEEAITVAKSTDNGETWTAEGKALGENSGYCPTADTNDDGQGHPYVASIGGSTKLYTLNRPAGDYEGVGLLVHNVEPSAANPLEKLAANEPVGIDPNTYAEVEVTVPTSGGVGIPVSTLGEAGSPEHIVAGPYEDYNAASPSKSIITCKGTNATPAELTGCTVAGSSPLTVKAKDDIVQVIATVEKAATIPAGPNKPNGEGGLEKLSIVNGNSVVSPLTLFVLNENAPNRVYIDGDTVYCTQSNANPTTKIEDCTNTSGSSLAVSVGNAITGDPILPPNASMTTGLKAPDGIVGTLPSYPGAPAGSTVILYTEKILADFVVGTTNGYVEGSTYHSGTIALPKETINYTPSVHPSEPLPASGSFKIYLGTEKSQPIQQVTCTGATAATQSGVPAGSYDLTGCSGGTGPVEAGFWIGGPNAAIAPYSALEKIGEGKNTSKGPEKLFSNNEDYSVLRAAYTINGVNFTDLGPISGTASETGKESGGYNDLSNPFQQESPESTANPTTATTNPTSPTNLTPGSSDEIELRYIGSRGTIITNPNGSYGMFLSGSWASDGDSDAFNQIFYTESANGKEWSVPKVVLSTDYTFSASAKQDEELAKGVDAPLGVSAYYSGRAYGPAVVQNPGGSLTMVFSGYRLPKPITTAGTVLGTNPSARYTIGAKDPALYRNILTLHLDIATTTSVSSSDGGSGVVGAPVTYTATVVAPGTSAPMGTVAFSDKAGPISGCTSQPLSASSPYTATCVTQHASSTGTDEIIATYSGDSNYATSISPAFTETTTKASTSTEVSSSDGGSGVVGAPVTYTATVAAVSPGTGTPTGTVSFSDSHGPISGCTSEPLNEGSTDIATCSTTHERPAGSDEVTASYAGDSNYAGSSGTTSETVDEAPAITSGESTTFTEGEAGSFTVTATGTPTPTLSESGTLPHGVSFDSSTGVLSGTPTQYGSYPITFKASNGVGSEAEQSFTLTVDAAPVFTSAGNATFSEGTAGSFAVTASGYPAPTITKTGGTLPAGVTFSGGVLSGAPTQEGEFEITFEASNSVGSVTQSFELVVDAAPVITSTDEATFNDHVPNTFTVTATGTPAPTFTKWGTLPEGVSLSNTGVLTGTPTQTGTFQITITATNILGSESQQFTLTVVGLHITTTSLPEVTPGTHYSKQLEATGGVTPYKWKRVEGRLPVGLKLSSTGLLSGTVSAEKYKHEEDFPITVTVTDSTKKVHQKATMKFTVVVS